MNNSNKVIIIIASAALAVIALAALGIGWMQFVSFRSEQEEIAQKKEREAQQEALSAILDECRDLRRAVNQSSGFMQAFESEIQTFSDNASQVKNLQDIKNAATQYTAAVDNVVSDLGGLSSELESKSLEDKALSSYRDSYIEVLQGFSSSLQDAKQAMELVVTVPSETELPSTIEKSQQQTMTAVASIEELSQTEANLTSDVNAYCEEANIQQVEQQSVN